MNEKIWCGKGKKSNYGIRISVCIDDLPSEFVTSSANGKRYISLDVNEKKDGADKWGNTHNVSVNTWKPDSKTDKKEQNNGKNEAWPSDNLPF